MSDREVVWVEHTDAPSAHLCPANVWFEKHGNDNGYESCGKKMRKHQAGEWYCTTHGMMH